MNINDLQDKLNQVQGKAEAHQQQYMRTVSQIAGLRKDKESTEKALVIAQEVAQKTQQELEYRISDIVSASLDAVFEDPYEFKVVFEIKRNKTEAKLIFLRDGKEIDPMTASGGGVIDIAAFALRIACFLISHPKPEPVFILDEAGKWVSEEYRPTFAQLLEHLAEKLNIQIIQITHCPTYEIGHIISFR